MKKLFDFLISMPLMGFLILFMAVSAGTATFIESSFGPVAARAAVYNAWWFELVILLIIINLVGNIFVRKVYKKKKLTIFLFHFSFVFIFLGAAVTRYISYEGTMHIREGRSSSEILSSDTWISGTVVKDSTTKSFHKKVLFTPGRRNNFRKKLTVGDESVTLKLVKFLPAAQSELLPDPEGKPILNLVVLNMHTREDLMLQKGDTVRHSGLLIGFGNNNPSVDLSFFQENGHLKLVSRYPVIYTDMRASTKDTIEAGTVADVNLRNIYSVGFLQVVPSSYQEKGRISYVAGNSGNTNAQDVLQMKVTGPDGVQTVFIKGHANRAGQPVSIQTGNLHLNLKYGAHVISLPFSLYLNDFQIERYPGSNSPSSYASKVTLNDPDKGVERPFRIYMNHILNYRGFRFFQSSYDQDEKGTILSVNHDALGTTLTYFGYFLMMLAMILSIFNKNSRFMKLGRSIDLSGAPKKIASMIVIMIMAGGLSVPKVMAQSENMPKQMISKNQAAAFSSVLIQDQGGRIKPFETMASEIVRKVAYKSSINGMTPAQVVLGMYFYPHEWQRVPMIRVSNDQVKQMLGINGRFASFMDFFDTAHNNAYKLSSAVQNAYQKDPAARSKMEQDIIKTDEKVNICYMVYTGDLLRIFPAPGDPNHRWYTPVDAGHHVNQEDSLFINNTVSMYFTYIRETNSDNKIIQLIDGIKKYQQTRAAGFIPPAAKVKMEIFYNKAGIFEKLSMVYGLVGFVLLVLLFFYILFPRLKIRPVINVSIFLIVLGFAFHTIGLGLRWYISGHAPWSNGYESMIYIAWAMVLAGILFARKSPFALAAGGILAALTLFVAHLSWMSPEITNLVPVLKSYWLSIHVSVITASYGFLGMGMVLGLFNLFLIIFKSEKNKERITQTITTLTRINEMTLILGVYFVVIGTFLGGIWANESWGRYWGWDPKETWALVTALVYVFIVHMRLIPGMRGTFAFNLASVLGFFSVIMTYFGVNYYLSGLHSYASGEVTPIPVAVYFVLAVLGLIVLFAYLNERKYLSGEHDQE
ncbi:MAG: cytochrome c biogenesis protein CcsA [Chlorobi bacterium]|nr:cytochrome c biogenesis protein CcsA [Chlorobiota bacterium]